MTDGQREYIKGVLANNVCRCEDVLWDLNNNGFDKASGAVAGLYAQTCAMKDSLTGLLAFIGKCATTDKLRNVPWEKAAP